MMASTMRAVAVGVLGIMLAGCGGTKLLEEAHPQQTTQPLASAADDRVASTLDWVIVRNGPGAWAKNADWDEYLLRIRNSSAEPILITNIIVVDSLDNRVAPRADRHELVKGSRQTARRYDASDIEVKAGAGAAGLLAAGAAVTAVGVSAAYGAAYGAVWTGSVAAGTATAVTGLLLLGPALAVGGILRGVNNSQVDNELQNRRTVLPITVPPEGEQRLDVFFPLAPEPVQVILIYVNGEGAHELTIDTQPALAGLHLAN